MEVVESHVGERVERPSPFVEENERLLEEAPRQRVRHEEILRVAQRRIRSGLIGSAAARSA